MRRGAALAAALVATALAAGPGLAGSGRTFAVSGAIEEISAEGGLAAAHVHPAHGCDYALVWQLSSSAARRVPDCSSSDQVIQDLTLVGGLPMWWDWSSGNHVYCDDVYRDGRGLDLCSGADADVYYEFAGDRTIAAIVDYSVCEADCTGANGELLPDGNYAVEVAQVKGGKVVPLLSPVDFRVFLDARNWRVATIEPKATLTVYDAAGRKLWSVPGVTGVYGGWIDGGSIVLHQPRAVRVYSRAGPGISRLLPRGAWIGGVVGGVVVYRAGSTVRVLRLADGRDRKLFSARGFLGPVFTPAGVFYAPGSTIVFVPIRDVLRTLR